MISTWYAGNRPVTQPWGCTDVTVEPFDARFPNCAHTHQGMDIGWIDPADQEWLVSAGLPGLRVVASYIVSSPYAESLLRLTNDVHDFWLFHGVEHLVAVGDELALNEPLMHVGAIGIAAGPHLHFEVRPAGSPYQPFNSIDPTPFLQPLPEASELPYSPGGNMALAPHPLLAGRIDEFVVGTDGHIYQLGGQLLDTAGKPVAAPGVSDWGGVGEPGMVSGAWMPDGSVLVCSVVGLDGNLYRKAKRLDGSTVFDWTRITDAKAELPILQPGPAGPAGPQGPKGDAGPALTTLPKGTILSVQ